DCWIGSWKCLMPACQNFPWSLERVPAPALLLGLSYHGFVTRISRPRFPCPLGILFGRGVCFAQCILHDFAESWVSFCNIPKRTGRRRTDVFDFIEQSLS